MIPFFDNSSRKASRLLFIFVRVNTGHVHFQNDKICTSWEPDRLTLVFFSYRTPEKSIRKARLKRLWQVATPPEKKPTFKPKLTNTDGFAYMGQFVQPNKVDTHFY